MIVADTDRPPQESADRLSAAELYALTFAGRQDAYSVWAGVVPSPPDSTDHWQSIRQPLTAERVLHAFDTGIPISGYFLNPSSMTHIAALDLDLDNGYALGQRFLRHLAKAGGVGYLEPSRRGSHVWIPLSETRPATFIRAALRALALEAGLPFDGENKAKLHPKVELRPGSDRLGIPGPGEEPPLGHCLRMPTMPHPKTGKRWGLITADGEKLSGKLVDMMLTIEECPISVLEDAALRAPVPDIPLAPPRSLTHPYGEREHKGVYSESAIRIMQDLWGVQEGLHPGRGFHCPAHPDRNKSAMVHRSDERVICFSPECELHNDGHGRGTYELTQMAPRRAT